MIRVSKRRASVTSGRIFSALMILSLTGCGGGGGGDTSATVNNAPVPPTISGTPSTAVIAGSAYSFTPTATGPSGAALSFSISNPPAWATFNTTSGMLSGTPGSSDTGTFANIVISVSDGSASASLQPFTITVDPPAGSAAVTWTAPTTNTDGSALTDLAGFYVNFGTSADSMLQQVQIASPGATGYTVTGLTSGTWYFSVSAYTTTGLQSAPSAAVSKTIS